MSPDRALLTDGYLAVPVATKDRTGPWPGVIVLHDAVGLSDDMREQADWLAAAGYVALVPDLYGGRSMLRCIKGVFSQLSARQGPAFNQIDAARTELAALQVCTGTVGVIGYCMGGAFALLLAARPGWSASSINYGVVPDDVADVLSGACPIIGSFGGKDLGLRGAAAKLQRGADAAGVEANIKEYPDAGHSFLNRLAVASPLVPLLKVGGIGYQHGAAADAKRRILVFFDAHLHS
jgi:carboxymethylenebutenolidase